MPRGVRRSSMTGRRSVSRTVPGRPGYRVTNFWTTLATPAAIDQPDRAAEHQGIAPPPNGTVIRVIDIPPESSDPEERKRQVSASFSHMFTDADHRPDQRHPGMHRTDSVDYAIVLMGELVAIMDDDETVMRAGDILIQRGRTTPGPTARARCAASRSC